MRCIGLGLLVSVSISVCAGVASHAPAQCDQLPMFDGSPSALAGARFGTAVAMSGDGAVALAGGAQYAFGTGIVRTFDRVGATWIEGPAISPPPGAGDPQAFGATIAMSRDASVAAFAASGEVIFSPGFAIGVGAVYIYERDGATGAWGFVQRVLSPRPGANQNFGASLAMTPDGSVLVIGESNEVGSAFDDRPDAAWVMERDAGGWAGPVELVPAASPGLTEEYGTQVAISDAGTRIAVSAPRSFEGETGSGEVYVFERAGEGWTNSQTLDRSLAGTSNNAFVALVAFDGDNLLVVNPLSNEAPGFGGPLYVYRSLGGVYPATPAILFPPESLGGPIALGTIGEEGIVRVYGDRALIGAPTSQVNRGVVFRLERDAGAAPDDPAADWRFVGRIVNDDGTSASRYGWDVAASDDLSEIIVGEPFWNSPELFSVGQVNFAERSFELAPFELDPELASVEFEISIPGLPFQVVTLFVEGGFLSELEEACTETGSALSIQLEGGVLRAVNESVTIDGPFGLPIEFRDLELRIAEPSATAAVVEGFSGTDTATLAGISVSVSATMQTGALPPMPITAEGPAEPLVVQLEGTPGTRTLRVPNFSLAQEIDVGLGPLNPQLFVSGSLESSEVERCPADLAPPLGELDFFDVLAYLTLFAEQDPAADLATPIGAFDFFDVLGYLSLFDAGC